MGVLFGYPLQFHIAIQIMLPSVIETFKCYEHTLAANLTFRSVMVIVTCKWERERENGERINFKIFFLLQWALLNWYRIWVSSYP